MFLPKNCNFWTKMANTAKNGSLVGNEIGIFGISTHFYMRKATFILMPFLTQKLCFSRKCNSYGQ